MEKSVPFWKWILLLLGCFIVFVGLYGLLQGVCSLSKSILVKSALCVLSLVLVLCIYALAVRLVEKRRPEDLPMGRALRDVSRGLAVGFLFFAAVSGVLALCGILSVRPSDFDWKLILLSFVWYIYVAVGEEVIFRGILFRMIDERYNMWVALAVSAVLFGVVHLSSPNASVWSSVAIAVEAGLMLALAYKYSGSLWLPIGIHCAWNFTEENVFGFAVSGWKSEASLMESQLSGPDILTGGAFGPEASLVSMALGIVISAAFLLLVLGRRK